MSTQTEIDLLQLRHAAEARDPEQTQFLLKKLFLQMEFFIALMVVVERVHPFVETFLRYYPDAQFAQQILVQMVNTGTAPRRLPPEAMQEFTQPGAGNFMKALSDMAYAMQPGALPPRIGYLVSASVNGIMAELVESWYGSRLEDWERVRANQFDPATGQYTDAQATQIAYEFWTDEAIEQRDIELWLAVADSIKEKIRKS